MLNFELICFLKVGNVDIFYFISYHQENSIA